MKRFQLTGIMEQLQTPSGFEGRETSTLGGRGGIMFSDMVKEFKFSEESIGAQSARTREKVDSERLL